MTRDEKNLLAAKLIAGVAAVLLTVATVKIIQVVYDHAMNPIEEVLCVTKSGHKRVPCP